MCVFTVTISYRRNSMLWKIAKTNSRSCTRYVIKLFMSYSCSFCPSASPKARKMLCLAITILFKNMCGKIVNHPRLSNLFYGNTSIRELIPHIHVTRRSFKPKSLFICWRVFATKRCTSTRQEIQHDGDWHVYFSTTRDRYLPFSREL